MGWRETTITLPPTLASMHQSAIATAPADFPGIAALQQLQGKISWPSSPQAGGAAGMAALRQQLETMSANGWMLTVHAWQHTVGKAEKSGCYLSPQNAIKRLSQKLTDSADPRLPMGDMQAVVVMVCAGELGQFIEQMKAVTDVLPLPGLLQAYRLAVSTAGLEHSKMEQGGALLNPYWPEKGLIVQGTQRDMRRVLLAELAQAGAAAASDPAAALSALVDVRTKLQAEQASAWQHLQGMGGRVWVLHAQGTPQNIAAALSAGVPGDELVHTAATLFVGDDLAFLRELLP
ncbi:hypothetical protein ACOGYG_002573 [Edwardsiella piscicida]|uniref:hypothetical protein n=1 Tax=Edwardsiella piscicida TaxID=1263550 RepID=UPI0002C14E57|nr:hypothetical protein [Edwardsiella piscicida]AGH72570.1 hypothetical protein ETAC_02185 [Edwardsiella piscicida C07-087]EKS7779965.1 hypothetical protein [Edwardsiella piscicida]